MKRYKRKDMLIRQIEEVLSRGEVYRGLWYEGVPGEATPILDKVFLYFFKRGCKGLMLKSKVENQIVWLVYVEKIKAA